MAPYEKPLMYIKLKACLCGQAFFRVKKRTLSGALFVLVIILRKFPLRLLLLLLRKHFPQKLPLQEVPLR